jgi:hypothetical protein
MSTSVKTAILEHQKECNNVLQQGLDRIWNAINRFTEHQNGLSNHEGTGKVDVMWTERQEQIKDERDRRKYWTRLILGSVLVFIITNLIGLMFFFGQLKALLVAHGIK